MATAPTPLARRNYQPRTASTSCNSAFLVLLTLDRHLFLLLPLSFYCYFVAAIFVALGSNNLLRSSDITQMMIPPRRAARALPCPGWEEQSEPCHQAATPGTLDVDGVLVLGPKVSYG